MDKLEKIARAMAVADGADPDAPISGWQFKRIVGIGITIDKHDPKLPRWNYYVPLAKVVVAAFDVLQNE